MRTDALGQQPGKVVGGQQHKGYCVGDEEGQLGRLNGILGYQGIQGGRGSSWMMRT